jgi:elongation factor P hydroxylase
MTSAKTALITIKDANLYQKIMKKHIYIPIIFSLTFLLSSCLTTLYPIFFKEDVEYNESLLGFWKCTDGSAKTDYMEFEKIPADRSAALPVNIRDIATKGYFITRRNSNGEVYAQYYAFLVKIGHNHFLDYYTADLPTQNNVNTQYKDHYIKVHNNYRIQLNDINHFEIRLFDKGYIEKLIAKNQINIRHEVVDGKIVITASTDELQKFIIKYSDNPDAYVGVTTCTRIVNL